MVHAVYWEQATQIFRSRTQRVYRQDQTCEQSSGVSALCPLGVAGSLRTAAPSHDGVRVVPISREKADHETVGAGVSCAISAAHGCDILCSGFGPLVSPNSREISKANSRKAYRGFESHLLRQGFPAKHSPPVHETADKANNGGPSHANLRTAACPRRPKIRSLQPLFSKPQDFADSARNPEVAHVKPLSRMRTRDC